MAAMGLGRCWVGLDRGVGRVGATFGATLGLGWVGSGRVGFGWVGCWVGWIDVLVGWVRPLGPQWGRGWVGLDRRVRLGRVG